VACFAFRAHKRACQNLTTDPVNAARFTAGPRAWPLAARLPALNARFAARLWKVGTPLGFLPTSFSLARFGCRARAPSITRLGKWPFWGTSADHSSVDRLITSESHRARDCQHESKVGDTPGSLRSDPAGITISRPLRVACGSGLPQFRQNEVEKLRAVGRSKRATLSSPDNQRNACGKTYAFAEEALPVALRHREQWHFTNLLNGRSASNSTDPQRHPPRTDISHLSGAST
jgi:hypothetical protein